MDWEWMNNWNTIHSERVLPNFKGFYFPTRFPPSKPQVIEVNESMAISATTNDRLIGKSYFRLIISSYSFLLTDPLHFERILVWSIVIKGAPRFKGR